MALQLSTKITIMVNETMVQYIYTIYAISQVVTIFAFTDWQEPVIHTTKITTLIQVN